MPRAAAQREIPQSHRGGELLPEVHRDFQVSVLKSDREVIVVLPLGPPHPRDHTVAGARHEAEGHPRVFDVPRAVPRVAVFNVRAPHEPERVRGHLGVAAPPPAPQGAYAAVRARAGRGAQGAPRARVARATHGLVARGAGPRRRTPAREGAAAGCRAAASVSAHLVPAGGAVPVAHVRAARRAGLRKLQLFAVDQKFSQPAGEAQRLPGDRIRRDGAQGGHAPDEDVGGHVQGAHPPSRIVSGLLPVVQAEEASGTDSSGLHGVPGAAVRIHPLGGPQHVGAVAEIVAELHKAGCQGETEEVSCQNKMLRRVVGYLFECHTLWCAFFMTYAKILKK